MLEKQVSGFISYCKVSGFSKKSLESLSLRLGEFNKFLISADISSISQISYRHILEFTANYRTPSIYVKKARVWSLRQFFHYLKLEGYVEENIATSLPYPKIERKVPHFLTEAEYNRILRYCATQVDSVIGLRNLCIIMMLGFLGLRTGTIISLNVQNIDIIPGLAWITEKGNRKRIMVLPKIICLTLKEYIKQTGLKSGPLFLSKRGKGISTRTLQDIFRKAADAVCIDKHLHSHLFRHTAATHLNRVAGTSITQHVLGHQLRKNTYKYTHLNPDYYTVFMKQHPFMSR